MIHYCKNELLYPWNFREKAGSVFPRAFPPAFFCGLASILLSIVKNEPALNWEGGKYWGRGPLLAAGISSSAAFQIFGILVGFLVIFRTQSAYARFWGCCREVKYMQAEFFNCGSNLVAFCRHSHGGADGDTPERVEFQHVICRLLSLLHATCLMQLRAAELGKDIVRRNDGKLPDSAKRQKLAEGAANLMVIDMHGMDPNVMKFLNKNPNCQPELLAQWIQSLALEASSKGVLTVPPPILSRIFQNMSNGLGAFYEASRVVEVPYPFPLVQVTEALLLAVRIVIPFVAVVWTTNPVWVFIVTFLFVFAIMALNATAAEIEDPFGIDANDLNLETMHQAMNIRLLMILKPCAGHVPRLCENAKLNISNNNVNNADIFHPLTDVYKIKHLIQSLTVENFDMPNPVKNVSLQTTDTIGSTMDELRNCKGVGLNSALNKRVSDLEEGVCHRSAPGPPKILTGNNSKDLDCQDLQCSASRLDPKESDTKESDPISIVTADTKESDPISIVTAKPQKSQKNAAKNKPTKKKVLNPEQPGLNNDERLFH